MERFRRLKYSLLSRRYGQNDVFDGTDEPIQELCTKEEAKEQEQEKEEQGNLYFCIPHAEEKDLQRMTALYCLLDTSALVGVAGKLYGAFLSDAWTPYTVVKTDGRLTLATGEKYLQEIGQLEKAGQNGVYQGYHAYLERNLQVIGENPYRTWLNVGEKYAPDFWQKKYRLSANEEENVFFLLVQYAECMNNKCVTCAITKKETTAEIFKNNGYTVKKI